MNKMMKRNWATCFILSFFLLSVIVTLNSCGASDTNGSGTSATVNNDVSNPTVISVSPINGTTNVNINTTIMAIFSEEVNAATINNASFTVSDGVSNIAGLVACSGANAVFTPTSALSTYTTYTATITTGVQDKAGNSLETNYVWGFITGSGSIPQKISGTVKNASGQPISNATVTVGSVTAHADSAGYYEFSDVAPGSYTLTASAPNYDLYSYAFTMPSGSRQIEIVLAATTLPQVSSISLTDGSYQIQVNWTPVSGMVKGYNVYSRYYLWPSLNANLYLPQFSSTWRYDPVYTQWKKINTSLITGNTFIAPTEEYNGGYIFYVAPVNVVDTETPYVQNQTKEQNLKLPGKYTELTTFNLTDKVGPFTISDISGHDTSVYMTFYYQAPDNGAAFPSDFNPNTWSVMVSLDGNTWSSVGTLGTPEFSNSLGWANGGYIRCVSLNTYKGKSVYFKTNPTAYGSSAQNADAGWTITNHIVEFVQGQNTIASPPVLSVSTDSANNQATIAWSSVSNATSYNLYWSTTNGVSKVNGTKISEVTNPYIHTNSNLTNNAIYYYVATAVNAAGESAESNQINTALQKIWTLLKLPDTGQTTCYDTAGTVIACAGTGQDGAYTLNAPAYTDNGNGTITDNVTGLIWQKQDVATSRTWADAITYCSGNTAGLPGTGWRLPNVMELATIADSSGTYPAINATYFPKTHSFYHESYYWSSTTLAGNASNAWYVYFGYGNVRNGSKTNSYYVRCVRGGQ